MSELTKQWLTGHDHQLALLQDAIEVIHNTLKIQRKQIDLLAETLKKIERVKQC